LIFNEKKILYFLVKIRDNYDVNGECPHSEKGKEMMIRPNLRIFFNCEECNGYGFLNDRHPNDPGLKHIVCGECDGSGTKSCDEHYDSISDAKDDYPKAKSFTYLNFSETPE
jgi:hypothetical protein|tara:strand:+ start:806 stop:1141 length:336 start_codon:yes stop_codon:yes gene_type:complete